MRKALIVGINYIGTSNELVGCIIDAYNIKNFLLRKGFLESEIKILTECTIENYREYIKDFDSSKLIRNSELPTRENILNSIKWLLNVNSKNKNSLYFFYSGHGGRIRDRNKDEVDGFDETIYDVNFNQIVDDSLYSLFKVKQGTRLFCMFDSCHSETVMDLKYVISCNNGKLIATQKSKKSSSNKDGDIIMISGCRDEQVSMDLGLDGGALTSSFLSELTSDPNFEMLIVNLNNRLKRYQAPCFSSNKVFVLKTLKF